MIVRTSHGAVLELVWLERGGLPWSRSKAIHFLSRFAAGRHGFAALRQLFSDREAPAVVWAMSDEALLQRAAWLVATDHILVGQYRYRDRHPGSGIVFENFGWSSVLYWRDKLDLERDRARGLEWFDYVLTLFRRVDKARVEKKKDKNSQKDEEQLVPLKHEVMRMRALTRFAPGIPDYGSLTDAQFLQEMKKALESRALIAIYHRLPAQQSPSGNDNPGSEPPKPQPGGDNDNDEDDPTFPPDHNGKDQGNTNNDAADNGNPFEEICELPKRGS
jgi:hypothetical protein